MGPQTTLAFVRSICREYPSRVSLPMLAYACLAGRQASTHTCRGCCTYPNYHHTLRNRGQPRLSIYAPSSVVATTLHFPPTTLNLSNQYTTVTNKPPPPRQPTRPRVPAPFRLPAIHIQAAPKIPQTKPALPTYSLPQTHTNAHTPSWQ